MVVVSRALRVLRDRGEGAYTHARGRTVDCGRWETYEPFGAASSRPPAAAAPEPGPVRVVYAPVPASVIRAAAYRAAAAYREEFEAHMAAAGHPVTRTRGGRRRETFDTL
jgi:hypothetical protein